MEEKSDWLLRFAVFFLVVLVVPTQKECVLPSRQEPLPVLVGSCFYLPLLEIMSECYT